MTRLPNGKKLLRGMPPDTPTKTTMRLLGLLGPLLICLAVAGSCLVNQAGAETYTRTIERYKIPDVTLINQDGARIGLKKMFSCNKPVFVDFVYTTCTTICPVLSVNFANFQKQIDVESGKALLVSISIDPEFDTPKEMKTYLKRYRAKPGWEFLTGSREDIDQVLKAFNVFTLNKMNHLPVMLLKSPSDEKWVRIYGLINAEKLLVEYEKVRY